MTYKVENFKRTALIAILVGIALIFAGWLVIDAFVLKDKTYFADVQDANSYSLNGALLKYSKNQIEIEVGQVITDEKGNHIEYSKYLVNLDSNTQIIRRDPSNKSQTISATNEDLSQAKNITVYTTTNPYNDKSITASKIEIN